MRPTAFLSASLAAMLVALLPAPPAQALNQKSFVSSTGGGTTCTRTSPCANFQDAHDATDAGGEINCLDSGPFGGATISRSMTIDCAGLAATSNGLAVNGASIIVRIRNLSMKTFGFVGIDFVNGAALFVENCIIKDFGGTAIGIRFTPSAPGSQLIVTDTVIDNNGVTPSTGGGIQIAPAAGGSAGVVLSRVRLGFNVTAMVLSSGNGAIGAVMTDSVVTSSRSNGILSLAGASVINFTIESSKLVNNVGVAIQSSGANSTVRISDSTIADNQTGVSAVSGGVVQSYKDNRIGGNGTDGTPLAAFPGPGGTPLQ